MAASAELEFSLTVGVVIDELRPILSRDQLREVGEIMEEIRLASELRFADVAEEWEAGEILGLEAASASTER